MLNKLKTKKHDLIAKRADALEKATKLYTDGGDMAAYKTTMEEVKGYNTELEQVDALIAESEKNFGGHFTPTDDEKRTEKTGSALLDTIRKGEDYTQSWALALSSGATPALLSKGYVDAKPYAPLMAAENAVKALTIGGGATPGEDGGFLVPKDFDLAVIEFSKDLMDLSKLTTVENVISESGWRTLATTGDIAPMQKVGEGAKINPQQQPSFGRVEFKAEKYADILPISNELFADAPGLMAYLAKWWAPLFVATKNSLILAELQKLTTKPLTGATALDQSKALKTILNTGMNTAYSRMAALLTNQSGFDAMDNWTDTTGRGLLQPDLKDETLSRFKGRKVLYYDNAQLADETVAAKKYHPLYVGDFAGFGRLFLRQGIRMKSTDIGGGAFETDSVHIRGTCRMDFKTINKAAMVRTGFAASAE